MNFQDAAAAIYARLTAGWAANAAVAPVDYENVAEVDLSTRQTPFVSIEIAFIDGDQASLGDDPIVRYPGTIYLSAWVKDGGGTAVVRGYMGQLAELFKVAQFGGVVTQAPKPMPARGHLGWQIHTLRVPFWFDDMPA